MARQPSLYELKMLGPEAVSSEETKVFCLLFGNRCVFVLYTFFYFLINLSFFFRLGFGFCPVLGVCLWSRHVRTSIWFAPAMPEFSRFIPWKKANPLGRSSLSLLLRPVYLSPAWRKMSVVPLVLLLTPSTWKLVMSGRPTFSMFHVPMNLSSDPSTRHLRSQPSPLHLHLVHLLGFHFLYIGASL